MKKIILAAAVVVTAIATQAASFSWTSSGKIADASGTALASATAYTTALNGGSIVLAILNDGSYNGNYTVLAGQTAPSFKSSPASKKATLSATYTWEWTETTPVLANGDVLGVLFKDNAGSLSQLVYTADGSAVSDTYTVSGLSDDTWAGTAFTYATKGNFTTAVPEPTSGLLLLIGMAGLALKRKVA